MRKLSCQFQIEAFGTGKLIIQCELNPLNDAMLQGRFGGFQSKDLEQRDKEQNPQYPLPCYGKQMYRESPHLRSISSLASNTSTAPNFCNSGRSISASPTTTVAIFSGTIYRRATSWTSVTATRYNRSRYSSQ